jgi:glutaredoxin
MAFATPIALIFSLFIAPSAAFSLERAIVEWVKSSKLLADLHQDHVAAPCVQHMMKATPLVNASDDDKMAFASGPWGELVADAMKAEQRLLGDWKLEKIKEAAGDGLNEDASLARLQELVNGAPVTVFSFVDCPWCLLAKKMLKEEPYNLKDGDGTLQIIELEDLAWEGKVLRAAIGATTGRTSMPAIFINGEGIGGFTDGFEAAEVSKGQTSIVNGSLESSHNDLRRDGAPGLQAMHESGELHNLILRTPRIRSKVDPR